MRVLLVSQCSGRAVGQTRRILDQFAERCGDRTWTTEITREGLSTLRRLLRGSARKNTAVACHWMHGRHRRDLIWIVGNSRKFNLGGCVPTGTTRRDVIKSADENSWKTLEVIKILSGIAGLFHDFGKAGSLFQAKLRPGYKGKKYEPFRHEWLSVRLFEAFVRGRSDDEWLSEMQDLSTDAAERILERVHRDDPRKPLHQLFKRGWPPVAKSIAWLILSHHRLPSAWALSDKPTVEHLDSWMDDMTALWNSPQARRAEDWSSSQIDQLWNFPYGLPICCSTWKKDAGRLAGRALGHLPLLQREESWLGDRFTMSVARMVLMLADHLYSSNDPTSCLQSPKYGAFANTYSDSKKLKQKLDEHCVGVARNAVSFARSLPGLGRQMPGLVGSRAMHKRVKNSRYSWQDQAFDLSRSLAEHSDRHGFFGVNMASTGCGKTFANARIIYGLSVRKKTCRFNVALGLRTLTLQTGDSLRKHMCLGEDEFAVLVGSEAVRELYGQEEADGEGGEKDGGIGSESEEPLIDALLDTHYEGSLGDSIIGKWLRNNPRQRKLHKLLSAPVLVSTIDYLMPATEGTTGGKQIAPMLRLLSSDLVLDEPDDFGVEDLPALSRLVHMAGMLGSKVLLSSATLPPSLVSALFEAYASGRRIFEAACGDSGAPSKIACAWFDEFGVMDSFHVEMDTYSETHESFVSKRIDRLNKKSVPSKLGRVLPPIKADSRELVLPMLADSIRDQVYSLHDSHGYPFPGNPDKKVSFGLVRMANIDALVPCARYFLESNAKDNYAIHFCVYHSRFPLAVRSEIERTLDRVLDRRDAEGIRGIPKLVQSLEKGAAENHIFIVFGSPVTEVGRDHDYDWMIAEPSSIRSLIQLAGRLQRHRQCRPDTANFLVLPKNVRALKGEKPAYRWPGFETKSERRFSLRYHDMERLLVEEEIHYPSSIPRIFRDESRCSRESLSALEHAHTEAVLFGGGKSPFSASCWWRQDPSWCAEMQRRTPFRKSDLNRPYVLMVDDEDEFYWGEILKTGELRREAFAEACFRAGSGMFPWVDLSPIRVVQALTENDWEDVDLDRVSRRYMTLNLPTSNSQDPTPWAFHPLLGVHREG